MNYEDHILDSYKDSLISILTYLSQPKTEPTLVRRGICYIVYAISNHWDNDCVSKINIQQLMTTWPLWSGDEEYPIPGLKGKTSEEMYHNTHNLWAGKYGDLRKDLCKYIVTKLKEQS